MAATLGSAMAFLESQQVIHRDLAARNVLVGRNPTDVKIADLGAARSVHRSNEGAYHGVYTATTDHAPARWMPLEALREAQFSHKSDVFSFGVLLWEILSLGQTPWGVFSVRDLSDALSRGERLQFPPALEQRFGDGTAGSASVTVARKIYSIALRCWAQTPRARPHFLQIEGELSTHNTVLGVEAGAASLISSGASSKLHQPSGAALIEPSLHAVATAVHTSEGGVAEGADSIVVPVFDDDGYVEDALVHSVPLSMLDEGGYVQDRQQMELQGDCDANAQQRKPMFDGICSGNAGVETARQATARAPPKLTLDEVEHEIDGADATSTPTSTIIGHGSIQLLSPDSTRYTSEPRGPADTVYNGFIGSADDADKHSSTARDRKPSLYLGFGQPTGGSRQAAGLHPDETRL
jgi:serine/threonine protein kinase